ncbi:hypothetical protein [Effusibacillus lacus]|uniref:Uncharacterized protein n=1 Tax=Effusibacillus lacus TaxID=1348429 RepID=A0A292YMB2_9BACL|nr:hypothetical protein [Effusibacillus lacus]TCS66186.1 hypothetical protein EDD64_1614 [Effusibacillus lacus]GAX90041.1 hypothetical protein EFBL_1667 [Effusibacillus lacus]
MKRHPSETVMNVLNERLNPDSIARGLSHLYKKSPSSKVDRGFWYNKSYPYFIQRFEETRPVNQLETVWIERASYVYSWIARIPVTKLDHRAIRELAALEHLFAGCTLQEVGTESYLGGLGDPKMAAHHGERIFGTGNGRPPVLIHQFVELANEIINYGSGRYNFPTTTKLLHFMFPGLFPIFDSNVCRVLYGNEYIEDYIKYHAYVFALQDYLSGGKYSREILVEAERANLPPLRLVDLVLFNEV